MLDLVNYTDKKENQIFLIYKEILSGAVAKSCMRKGFLIYEEMRNFSPYMRRPLVIYVLQLIHSEFPYTVYEEKFSFFFISVL
jgi:hypothetical protein